MLTADINSFQDMPFAVETSVDKYIDSSAASVVFRDSSVHVLPYKNIRSEYKDE